MEMWGWGRWRWSYVCPNVHMAPLNTSLDFLMLNKEIGSAYTKLAPCQGAICVKFPAVRLINLLKISKGRSSCRKLIVTVAILLWIIFLFNILCSAWFSLLRCLPGFCSFWRLWVVLCFNSLSLLNCCFCCIHHLWPLYLGREGQRMVNQFCGFLCFDLIAYSV